MKKTFSLALQYVVFLGLGIFLIWWSVRNLTADEVGQLKGSLHDAHYLMVMPAVVMLLLSHYSRALRWKMLMEPLGFQPSNTNAFFAVMLGYFFNLLVPRMGEVMKCTMLARYEKTPVDKLIGTMVAERAVDVVCLLLVIGLTFFLQMDLAGTVFRSEFQKIGAGSEGSGGFASGLMVLAAMAGLILVITWLLRRFRHITFVVRLRNMARGVWQGLTSIRHIRNKAGFLFHTLFIWTMYLMSIRMGFYAMDAVSHLGMAPSFTILTVGSLAMILTQGGIGAYQIAVQKSLSLYAIPAVGGLAFGWLLWAFQTILVLVVGLSCLLLLPVINRKKS